MHLLLGHHGRTEAKEGGVVIDLRSIAAWLVDLVAGAIDAALDAWPEEDE